MPRSEGTTAYQRLRESVLAEAKDDYVGLWSIMWKAKRLFPEASSEELKQIVLRLMDEVLSDGSVVPGEPADEGPGFLRWPDNSTESMKRIESGWAELGREPGLGDVVWITTPD